MRETSSIYIFEGVDEVGKSSLITLVSNKLNVLSVDHICVHFPGKKTNRLGELVDNIHHNKVDGYSLDLSCLPLQMLHVASHLDLEEKVIFPAKKDGKVIILDRSWLSTLAYGRFGGIESKTLDNLVGIEREVLSEADVSILFYVTRNHTCIEAQNEIAKIYEKYIKKYFKDRVERICNNDNLYENCDYIVSRILEDISEK